MEIASILKTARAASKLSQEQAAEALGVSRQTVSNWETGKTYPDILSAIRMSDLYQVSMDRLLKEELPVKQSYAAYLKESADTVKSHDRLTKTVLIAAAGLLWAAAQGIVWLARGPAAVQCGMALRWCLLPLAALIVSCVAARCDFWGRGKWLLIPVCALAALLVPYTAYAETGTEAAFTFIWVNLRDLPVGALSALAGLGLGTLLRRRQSAQT